MARNPEEVRHPSPEPSDRLQKLAGELWVMPVYTAYSEGRHFTIEFYHALDSFNPKDAGEKSIETFGDAEVPHDARHAFDALKKAKEARTIDVDAPLYPQDPDPDALTIRQALAKLPQLAAHFHQEAEGDVDIGRWQASGELAIEDPNMMDNLRSTGAQYYAQGNEALRNLPLIARKIDELLAALPLERGRGK